MSDAHAKTTIDQILFAVMELIRDGGLPAATLSAVCKRAGISKGGLMHHYPSKEALVDAFIARSADQCLAETHSHLATIPRGEGRRTKAYVNFTLREPMMCDPTGSREVSAVMIALMQGRLTHHAMGYYQRIADELRGDGVSKSLRELIVTSIDGLWMQSAFLPQDVVAKRANQVRLQLLRMIQAETKPMDQ
ncbi:HTH-type transcriptional regulator BetI [Rubripirellula tenax]|uniref:HTH-type transcriptional regulator BetI n=1 Tax=Rubripirellula tenax TaxID=2528015 RepID=A0A5C6FB20_9BACT|nr:TetR/AcrR family transcriptional regulator [Rubripirellula tenax]TWU58615.1 HTH-type transcriptional regulator BetI [Rubripirellula tenax]